MHNVQRTDARRGQVGIGTLIVFIAMVLVAAIAAGVLINTAGFLQSQSEETGEQSSQQVTNRLNVQTATGLVTSVDGQHAIGAVELTATKAAGAEDIDLRGVTVQWVDDSGSYMIVHDEVYENQDGAFDHITIKDEDDSLDDDGSAPVINTPDDRVRLLFDIAGNDNAAGGEFATVRKGQASKDSLWDVSGSAHTFRANPTRPIPEGSNAELRIMTRSGATTTMQLTIPASLSGTSTTSL